MEAYLRNGSCKETGAAKRGKPGRITSHKARPNQFEVHLETSHNFPQKPASPAADLLDPSSQLPDHEMMRIRRKMRKKSYTINFLTTNLEKDEKTN